MSERGEVVIYAVDEGVGCIVTGGELSDVSRPELGKFERGHRV